MSLFFTKRGKVDRWYIEAVKQLNDTYYNSKDTAGTTEGTTASQRANDKFRELENAKNSLKQDYIKRLEAIGQKPASDFSRMADKT